MKIKSFLDRESDKRWLLLLLLLLVLLYWLLDVNLSHLPVIFKLARKLANKEEISYCQLTITEIGVTGICSF